MRCPVQISRHRNPVVGEFSWGLVLGIPGRVMDIIEERLYFFAGAGIYHSYFLSDPWQWISPFSIRGLIIR